MLQNVMYSGTFMPVSLLPWDLSQLTIKLLIEQRIISFQVHSVFPTKYENYNSTQQNTFVLFHLNNGEGKGQEWRLRKFNPHSKCVDSLPKNEVQLLTGLGGGVIS